MKKILIAILAISGVALAWAAPPLDRLPELLVPPSEARITSVIVGGSVPAAPSCTTLADTRTETDNYDYSIAHYLATNFIAASSYTLCKIDVPICMTTSDTGYNMTAYIYSNTGTYPGTDVPSTSLGQSTNTVAISGISACGSGYTTATFNFSGVSITSGTEYWIALYGPDKNYALQWRGFGASGQDLYYSADGSSWTQLDANMGGNFNAYR